MLYVDIPTRADTNAWAQCTAGCISIYLPTTR
jgi:hypothetical protein